MIHYTKDTDKIVTLQLDMSGRSGNVINHELGKAFNPVIEHLLQEKARHALRGIVLTSAKKTFLEGGDLEHLYQTTDKAELYAFAQRLKSVLRALEQPGIPVVAAINGDALGLGFEVALACHHRIVIDNPKIRLGHPEVNIGSIPSGGAIVRLMWLLGIERAWPILMRGLRYSPQEAIKVGIIDELARDQKDMLERAKSWLLNRASDRRPWDTEHETIPGGTAADVPIAEKIREMTAQLSAETHDNYPALRAILDILSEGSKVDFDTALRIDSRRFAELVSGPECKNMISTFWFDQRSIKSGINRPKGYGRFRPRKVGVIGAGLMGSGIALACLRRGLEVVLKDVSKPIAARGREFIARKLDEYIEQGTFQPSEREEFMAKLRVTDDAADFRECDIIIEAVFENSMVKKKVTREAEVLLDEYSIFGSNTISIPITQLAEASLRPENYVGLHFFAPAEEVPLVEIVRGTKTSEETVARAFDFAIAIRKIPIVVKDDWGFYAARVLNTYILEGITLLEEGYPPALIENLGLQTGMSRGPLAYADDTGLHIVRSYENQAAEHYGSKYIQHPAARVLDQMIEELERPGRAKRGGFYAYSTTEKRRLWPELAEHFPVTITDYDRREISDRLLFAQVLEAVWCLQEGVIMTTAAANLGSVYGWGFPAFKGGVIRFVHDYGVDAFLARCADFEKRYGPRFKAPRRLRELVQ